MSANARWSPYPDSILDIPKDASFFDVSTATGEALDDIAAVVGVQRWADRVVPRDVNQNARQGEWARQPEPAHDFVPQPPHELTDEQWAARHAYDRYY
jgi:hypothetical protein